MEEVQCGNLKDLLISNKSIEVINWKLRYRITFQLADALQYLHSHDPKKSYVHLDVKPDNVLLTLNLCVKLADFGALDIAIATDATTTKKLPSSKEYTPLYTAPERLQDVFNNDSKTSMDVYR